MTVLLLSCSQLRSQVLKNLLKRVTCSPSPRPTVQRCTLLPLGICQHSEAKWLSGQNCLGLWSTYHNFYWRLCTVCMMSPWRPEEGVGSPGTRVRESCELCVGSGNWILDLLKSNQCLSHTHLHLPDPNFYFLLVWNYVTQTGLKFITILCVLGL